MTSENTHLRLAGDLKALSASLAADLLASSSKFAQLFRYQLTLLEVFSREVKKLERLRYCDYELAFVCFQLVEALNKRCSLLATPENSAYIKEMLNTVQKKQTAADAISAYIHTALADTEDPLLSRFNSLKTGSPDAHNELLSAASFKFRETVTPQELHQMIKNGLLLLLVDLRTEKEYNYSHINYPELVNIEPSHVSSLYSKDVTDSDLEDRLKMHLSDSQFRRFQLRYKYDLVVVYNLRYGYSSDRFTALRDLVINETTDGIISASPFEKLIDIITYRNKYISSKLRQHPLVLTGGMFAWHKLFGDQSLTKSIQPKVLSRPQSTLSRNGSSGTNSFPSITRALADLRASSSSPYLKNFGDYLSTAKTSSVTPISNPFIPGQGGREVSTNAHEYGHKNTSSMRAERPSYQTPPSQQPPPRPTRTLSSGSTLSLSRSKSSSESLKEIPKLPPATAASSKDTTKFLEQYATGLTNLGNSCYMNCILQCLGATPQLTRFFFPAISTSSANLSLQSYRQHINVNNKLGSKGILTVNFVSLLGNMFNNTGKSFKPLNFKKVVGSLSPGQEFATFDQQDCIEFLNFILDGLHEDLNQMIIDDPVEKKAIAELTPEQEKTREVLPVRLASTIEWERYLKLNFSVVVDFFQGQFLSQLRCLECQFTSTTYNAFSILSVPIPEKMGNTFSPVLLDDCLKEFTTTELLDDDNKWHCTNCKRFTKLTKKITITRLPQVLIIHFKRFKITPSGYFNKIDDFITYPVNDVLDLTSYWPEVGTSVNPKSAEYMPKDQEKQILSTLPTRNQQPPFRYKLYGVANHFGNLTTGHYTAYVHKSSDTKKTRNWCYFDDANVTYNCKENQVLNKNAYCLFYQRV